MATFEQTGLLPAVVAEDVMRQLGITDTTLIDYVKEKTQNVYRENEKFRAGLRVEHWIRGEHGRREKCRQLDKGTCQ